VAWVEWKLVSVRSKVLLISTQDWCLVCAKRAIGSEIILGAPMELLGDMGEVEARFDPFGDVVKLGAR
jgi:hypothetical protein